MARMSHRWWSALAAAMLCGVLPAAAADGPVLRADASSTYEVDLGRAREDLLPLLRAAMRGEEPREARDFEDFLDVSGVRALDRLRLVSRSSLDRSCVSMELDLDPHADGGILAALCGVSGGRCRFARYVREDDVLAFATLENLPGSLEALLPFLTRPATGPEAAWLDFDADGEPLVAGIPVRGRLLPLLAGEIDVMQLLPAAGGEPAVVLAVAAHDGAALRDLLLDLVAGQAAGAEAAAMLGLIRGLPSQQVGDFQVTALPMGPSLAVSRDFLVLASDPAVLQEMLARPRGDLRVPRGHGWLFARGAAMSQWREDLARRAAARTQAAPALPAMAQAFDGLHFDRLEIRAAGGRHRLDVEFRAEGSPLNAGYRALCGMLAAAAADSAGTE
ncbi:MAG: hypothetical protein C0395_03035 [Gemmatimonas sp.]|nr:hypothetical protein [Gemmatimonas sp.]